MRGRWLIALLALLATAVHAEVIVTSAWSRATPPSTTVGVVYVDLLSKQTDELIAIETSVADRAEVHASSNESGTMKMRQLSSVPLPATVRVRFQPGGMHVMLIGLHKPLVAGASFPLTLKFRTGTPVVVQVKVLAPGEREPR